MGVMRAHDVSATRAAAERAQVNQHFFAGEDERIAELCHRMAVRFARGGRLVAFGASPAARSDVRHVAVEFVHPVIVGKRALPAIGLTPELGDLATQVELLASAEDIAMAFEASDPRTAAALERARRKGCLTIAFEPAAADWVFDPPAQDPFIRQELVEVLYHLLWEHVHVFFEHRGLLEGRHLQPTHDAGRSSFLYPFLAESESDRAGVFGAVRESVRLKAQETAALMSRTLEEGSQELLDAARLLRASTDGGGTVLVLGNGGSATDAMDLVADLQSARNGHTSRRALDLTADSAILTALANDIGAAAVFSRQVIAYGRPGDVVVAISTSGNSTSVLEALREARRRGLATVALVGYDGGEVASQKLADHVVLTRSAHIPRIQEAQASAYHVMRQWIESPESAGPNA